MKVVTVVGAGYVGLNTAAALVLTGTRVQLIDVDHLKIQALRNQQVPFYEPYLEEVLAQHRGMIDFHHADYAQALQGAEAVFVCVGTPSTPSGRANISYVQQSVQSICAHATEDLKAVVIKSTVPVGTTQWIQEEVARSCPELHVAHCPEFLRQGSALIDSLFPDRFVLGVSHDVAKNLVLEIFAPVLDGTVSSSAAACGIPTVERKPEVFITDSNSSELAKYAANAFLATKISFINEIANLCDHLNADVVQVADIIGADKRIGRHFLNAGIGYGGSCFPKDTRALHHIARLGGQSFNLLNAVIEVNNNQKFKLIDKIDRFSHQVRKVGILGLAFKPNTDDMREAPSIEIIEELIERGIEIIAYDPVATDNAKRILPPQVKYAAEVKQVFADVDLVILLTEWKEFIELPWKELRSLMRHSVVLDGRNALDPGVLQEAGYHYQGIGRRRI